MHKATNRAVIYTLGGMLFCGITLAQQTPTPSTNPPAGSTSTTATPKTQTTAKPGTATAKKAPVPLTLKTDKDKESYAIGLNIGKGLKDSLKKDDVDVNSDLLLRGMKDALGDAKPLLTEEETRTVLNTLQADMRKHQKEVHDTALAKNTKEGEEFLAANKAKPGVVTLPSGLQYKILAEGSGPKPTVADTIVCNYKGTLLDGTEFDSSYKRGQPATIPVGRVIKGWTEALQLMPVGSKWELYIPPSLAYGEQGTNGGPIGPNATLVFDVELLSIQQKPEPKPVPPIMTSPDGQTKTQPVPQSQPSTPPPSQAPPPATKPQ
jgi:FKBP-type peptidyl-prolyl cis-trans isomerase FklB